MKDTSKPTIKAVGKEKSMIERAMDSGKLHIKTHDDSDITLDFTDLDDTNPGWQIESAQIEQKSLQQKETERITMAIQAVEIKLLQDRVAELKTHLAHSEILCDKLVKEKQQLIQILSENKLKAGPPPKKYWPSFWK